MLNLEEDQLQ
jgi:hypothetical protein